ncbi:alcohol dehydrogenase catalytic domain-containing protein [Methylomonas sp. SURF-2]|uniref:Alcohol dehydrogenase catalytic domain-containing protein n=1 Tax=Methylomonas subterranea TaxID=2952225 RepID=A0ABT1TJK7_9GAMM|nr:alcohol dehydrogenase catalytic domain-containing protein [Methylomonas sp. SURF-2]MCQ8105656.1 alcohol dehydrogenase catalytic domain-containing protein [Methylomonas sp. SURF-2]
MQALELNNALHYRLDKAVPDIGAGEALIRMTLAGICATDLELVKGYAGFSGVIGHEFVGVVEAVGSKSDSVWLDKRVVGSINIGCGDCAACLGAGPEHCLQRKVLGIRGRDGAFADYLRLPVANLYQVPAGVADEEAVFTEPLAAALRVVGQLELLSVGKVAVVGPGRLGLLIAKVLALAGYDVEVLGRSETSLALPAQWGLRTGLTRSVPDNSYHFVVDASGQSGGFAEALRLTRPRGIVVQKSTFSAAEAVDLGKLVVGELTIMGSRCGPFDAALALLEQGVLPLRSMVDGRYRLIDGMAALRHAGQAGVRKILLQP